MFGLPSLSGLLGIGLIISLVAGAGGTLWYRGRWESDEAALAQDKAQQAANIAAAEKAVADAQAKDAAETNVILAAKDAKIDQLQRNFQDAIADQRIVVDTPTCDHTPASDAFDGSLRTLYGSSGGKAGAGKPGATGRPDKAVPARLGTTFGVHR
jgi:hypothetical protein